MTNTAIALLAAATRIPLAGAADIVPPVGKVRLYPETVLVADGRANCVVVKPGSDQAFADLAASVAAGLRAKYGVDFPVVADSEACRARIAPVEEDFKSTNLIIVGNLNNNRAILPLYANFWCGVDAYYPGGNGHVLRTVSNPCGTGKNCVIVGASSPTGGKAAIRAFLSKLPDELNGTATLPRLLTVQLDNPELEAAFESIKQRETGGPGDQYIFKPMKFLGRYYLTKFTRPALWYHWTGRPYWMQLARQHINDFNRLYKGHYRMSHYQMEGFFRAWDVFEEAPILTDEERQLTIQHLAETAIRNPNCEPPNPSRAGSRHTVAAGISAYAKMRYLRRTLPKSAAWQKIIDQWKKGVNAYFSRVLTGYRDSRDRYSCEDSMEMFLRWALSEGRAEHFQSGLARQGLQYSVYYNDSLSYTCGLADYGEALLGMIYNRRPFEYHTGLVGFALQDPRVQWLRESFLACQGGAAFGGQTPSFLHGIGRYTVQSGARRVPPKYLLGMSALPLSPRQRTESLYGVPDAVELKLPPPEQDVDKVCFRSGFEPQDQYLLLQGIQSFLDGNTIPRYTDRGKVWLFHNTDGVGVFPRNGVFVSNGVNDTKTPYACRVEAMGRFDDFSVSSTTLPDYRGTDWTRTIFWRSGEWFVVLDSVTVKKPDHYAAICSWRTPVDGRWRDDRFFATTQQDTTLHIVSSFPVVGSADRLPKPDGAGRPCYLRQMHSGQLEAGDVMDFQNLLCVTAAGDKPAYEPWRVDDATILLKSTTGEPMLLGVGGARASALGIEADGGVFALTPSAIYVAGTSMLRVAGLTVVAGKEPVTRRIDLSTGATIAAYNAGQIKAASRTWDLPALPKCPPLDEGLAQRLAAAIARQLSAIGGPQPSGLRQHGPETEDASGALALLHQNAEAARGPRQVTNLKIQCDGATGNPAEAVDGIVSSGYGSLSWPSGTPARFTVSWDRPETLTEVRIAMSPMGRFSPNLLKPVSKAHEMEIAWNGREATKLSVDRKALLRLRTKATLSVIGYLSVPGLGTEASSLSVTVSSTSQMFRLSEVQVFTQESAPLPIHHLLVEDLDRDGRPEILVNAGEGVVSVLDDNGKLRWQRRFLGLVTSIAAADLDGDGRREVLTTGFDHHVRAFTPNGRLIWDASFAGLYERTKGRFYGMGATPFAAGLWEPKPGLRRVLVGGYCYLTLLDANGNILTQIECNGRHFRRLLDRAIDLDGDGLREVIYLGRAPNAGPGWAVTVKLDADGQLSHEYVLVPNGDPLCGEVLGSAGDRMAVISPGGFGLYKTQFGLRPRDRAVWHHLGTRPISAGLLHDTNGDGQQELVIAGLDGFVAIHAMADGKAIEKHVIGDRVNDLILLTNRGRTSYLIATDHGLHVYDAKWQRVGTRAGAYVKLAVLDASAGTCVAVTEDGRVEILRATK